MNKTLIYAGVGAVAAYLLYKKFGEKKTEQDVAEEQTDETAQQNDGEETGEAGGEPISGGGGGGSAPAPQSPKAPSKGKDLAKEREGKGQVKTMASLS